MEILSYEGTQTADSSGASEVSDVPRRIRDHRTAISPIFQQTTCFAEFYFPEGTKFLGRDDCQVNIYGEREVAQTVSWKILDRQSSQS